MTRHEHCENMNVNVWAIRSAIQMYGFVVNYDFNKHELPD